MLPNRGYSARYIAAIKDSPRAGIVFNAATDTSPAEIMIYDQIGASFWDDSGVTAKDVIAALASADGKAVNVRINSPGGDVFEGYAIYNALQGYKGGVETTVDGLAASAASWIALAGDKVTMGPMSMFMIHDSSTMAFGNKQDLLATAGILSKLDNQFAEIYAAKTGKSVADMAAAMTAETFYTAAEAKEAGFADVVLDTKVAAKTDPAPADAENVVDPAIRAAQLRRFRLALTE